MPGSSGAAPATRPGTSPRIGPLTPRLLKETLARANKERAILGKAPLTITLDTNPPIKFANKPKRSPRGEVQGLSGEPLTPQEHLEAMAAYAEAGATHIVVKFDGREPKDVLRVAERFAKEVMEPLNRVNKQVANR